MTSVQIEIFNALRASGMSEERALKAAVAMGRRQSGELQNRIQQFKWLFAAAVLACLLFSILAR
jgi:hypothetical protein